MVHVVHGAKDDGLMIRSISWQYLNAILEKNTDYCATLRTFEAAYIETWCCNEERKWDLIMAAVKQNGLVYEFVTEGNVGISTEVIDCADAIAVAAVQQNGLVLEHVLPSATNYKLIVEQAVKQNGLALQHADLDNIPYTEMVDIVKKHSNRMDWHLSIHTATHKLATAVAHATNMLLLQSNKTDWLFGL